LAQGYEVRSDFQHTANMMKDAFSPASRPSGSPNACKLRLRKTACIPMDTGGFCICTASQGSVVNYWE
jgi:hypothetical protein